MSQVRLNPTTVQNVVTYAAIIDAPNPALKLKPGMTANVTIEVARRDDVLRVPAAALRFKPDAGGAGALRRRGVKAPAGKSATVWVSNGTTIAPVTVTLGASDGAQTEIVKGSLADGALVVTRAAVDVTTSTTARASATAGNPLMPAARGPGGPR